MVITIYLKVKKIALQISKGTNKYRYSNSKNLSILELPDKESISKLLAQTPPFDVYSGNSHLNLAKEFTISKGAVKVLLFIFMNNQDVNIKN